jgi:hypothetical protein
MATYIYAHMKRIPQYTNSARVAFVPSEKLCMRITHEACQIPRNHEKSPGAGIGINIPGCVRNTMTRDVSPEYIVFFSETLPETNP